MNLHGQCVPQKHLVVPIARSNPLSVRAVRHRIDVELCGRAKRTPLLGSRPPTAAPCRRDLPRCRAWATGSLKPAGGRPQRMQIVDVTDVALHHTLVLAVRRAHTRTVRSVPAEAIDSPSELYFAVRTSPV